MELVKAENLSAQFQGMSRLPVVRQVGLLVGLAASIALGVSIVMWSHTPNYSVLFGSLNDKDASAVVASLQKNGIEYKVDPSTGAVMVAASKVHEARLKLAAEGLPHSSDMGFELMEKQEGFGTSQFLEKARYQRAMEGELARTIMSLNAVANARVHLALPKDSVFIRDRRKATASVFVDLYPGRTLDEGQVAAVVHMVASSVPNLEPGNVTVVDQQGQLLTAPNRSHDMALSASQFAYERQVEQSYVDRIQNILAPIVGSDGVRAQVMADLDFTVTEQTQEVYNPDLPAVRSEQSFEEQTPAGSMDGGVPGALSNEPPGAATAPQQTAAGTARGAGKAAAETVRTASAKTPMKTVKRSTMNYELDKTISHTRRPTGAIKRLSVAVVVDEKQTVNDTGDVVHTPRTQAEIDRITSLVKDAVGFNAQRGDTINVISSSFATPPQLAPLPEPPLWKQPWVWDIAKQVGGLVAIALLFFGVLRPVMRSLATRPIVKRVASVGGGEVAEDQLTLSGDGTPRLPRPDKSYDSSLSAAKGLVSQDPKRVAQVVKNWVANES